MKNNNMTFNLFLTRWVGEKKRGEKRETPREHITILLPELFTQSYMYVRSR